MAKRSHVLLLAPAFIKATGRPRSLTFEAFSVAAYLNGSTQDHRNLVVRIAAYLNGMTEEQRRVLGVTRWHRDTAHDHVGKMLADLTQLLSVGVLIPISLTWGLGIPAETLPPERLAGSLRLAPEDFLDETGRPTEPLALVDENWFIHAITISGIDPSLPKSSALALDGTAWETSARLHGNPVDLVVDGDAEYPNGATGTEGAPADAQKSKSPLKVLGVGQDDGRAIYTLDTDARAGHRTATNSQRGGQYTGYEIHIAAQVADLRHTNYSTQATLGDPVPGLIRMAVVTPAGAHRGNAVTQTLIALHRAGSRTSEVISDPGYSLSRPETFSLPLIREGIKTRYEPKQHQRGVSPKSPAGTLRIDDSIFHPRTPKNLHGVKGKGRSLAPLPYPERNASAEDRAKAQQPFDTRAPWRFRLHKIEGDVAWFICPFCAGALTTPGLHIHSGKRPSRRARPVPQQTMHGLTQCCDGLVRIPLSDLGRWQDIPAGTAAHRTAYHSRRQQIENSNSQLKASFTSLDKNHTLVFGRVKRTILLAFTLAGVNARIGRTWLRELRQRARTELAARQARRRCTTAPVTTATAEAQQPPCSPRASQDPP